MFFEEEFWWIVLPFIGCVMIWTALTTKAELTFGDPQNKIGIYLARGVWSTAGLVLLFICWNHWF